MSSAAEATNTQFETAKTIAVQFSALAEVVAVALGGSVATGKADTSSDIDLYVFARGDIALERRRALIAPRSSDYQLDNRWWETEYYWYESATGIKVETIYRDPNWLEQHLETLLSECPAQLGCSTSLWHSVATSQALFDRGGWFARLQNTAATPYPDELAHAIINKNFPLLRGSMAAHPPQIKRAFLRQDLKVAFQRIYQALDSYFDILFALNRTLHPGEKRQLEYAQGLERQPDQMTEDVNQLLNECDPERVIARLETLIDRLEVLLGQEKSLSD